MKKPFTYEVFEVLKTILELDSQIKEMQSESEDEDEDEIGETNQYFQEYKDLVNWAFGGKNPSSPESAKKIWKKHHPDLPELNIENCSPDQTRIVVSYQITMHWFNHKK